MFTVPTGVQTTGLKVALILLIFAGMAVPSYLAYHYYTLADELEDTNGRLEQTVQSVLNDLDRHAKLYKDVSSRLRFEQDKSYSLIQELDLIRGSTPEIKEWEDSQIPNEVLNVLKGGRGV